VVARKTCRVALPSEMFPPRDSAIYSPLKIRSSSRDFYGSRPIHIAMAPNCAPQHDDRCLMLTDVTVSWAEVDFVLPPSSSLVSSSS